MGPWASFVHVVIHLFRGEGERSEGEIGEGDV